MCRVISSVVRKCCLLWPVCSLDKTVSLCPASFCPPRPNYLLFWVSLDFLLLHSFPYDEKDIIFRFSSRRPCRSWLKHWTSPSSALLAGAYTWITVILNSLHWKWTEITLSFSRLHPSTAFWTLLLTMRATPFLLRDSLPTVVDVMVFWIKFTHSCPF